MKTLPSSILILRVITMDKQAMVVGNSDDRILHVGHPSLFQFRGREFWVLQQVGWVGMEAIKLNLEESMDMSFT